MGRAGDTDDRQGRRARDQDGSHVLLIEPSRSFAALVGELLRTGWEGSVAITHAETFEDMHTAVLGGAVNAILLGGQDIVPLLEQVRTFAPTVPVVVLAHAYSSEEAVLALRAGAQDYIATSELTASGLARAVAHSFERKRSEATLAQRALQDPLTGLPNRTLFIDRVGVALDRARRTGGVTAVLFLDVDAFKEINDSRGHAAGDEVLTVLAGRLRAVLRPMDTVARFGGDEFTFVFEGLATPDEAVAIAERVRSAASEPISLQGDSHQLSVSIGVATTADPTVTPDALIREADLAMYASKRRGGDRAEASDAPVTEDVAEAEERPAEEPEEPDGTTDAPDETTDEQPPDPLAIEASGDGDTVANGTAGTAEAALHRLYEKQPSVRTHATALADTEAPADELRMALALGQLSVVYQPRYGLGGAGRLTGFEALVRWNHPTRGTLPAAEFMPLAEELGLVNEIGMFVLGQALDLLKRIREVRESGLTVSINLSGQQLSNGELAAALSAVEAAGVQPASICADIPERAVSDDPELARRAARVLHAAGIRVAVDDYGTGDVSLSHLRRMNADELKIHESFVRELGDGTQAGVVRAVVELGHALGMTVVAEGVETEGQLAELRSLGCDVAHGFLLCRPVGAEQLEEIVTRAG